MNAINNILAIDTATKKLSLALAYGSDRLVRSDNMVDKTHGQILLKKIDDLMNSADLDKDKLQALVVATGPGSFTGLRIGIAAAKGMAIALDIPILGISIFDLFAKRFQEVNEEHLLLAPARKGEFYLGVVDSGVIKSVTAIPEGKIPEMVNEKILFGAAFEPFEIFPDINLAPQNGRFDYGGSDLINYSREKFDSGISSDLISLEPMYVQKSIAEIRLDERRSKG